LLECVAASPFSLLSLPHIILSSSHMELEYLKMWKYSMGQEKFPAQHLKEKLQNMHGVCINIMFGTLTSY